MLHDNKTRPRKDLLKYAACIPALIYLILFAILSGADLTWERESPALLFALNTLFLAIIPFFAACFAAGGYLQTGSSPMLLMGCGLLAICATSFLAGWSALRPDGANNAVTIFNCGFLMASILHGGSAVLSLTGFPGRRIYFGGRRLRLGTAFAVVLGLILLITLASLGDLTPVFFIQGTGPTLVRQLVLGFAVTFFALTSAAFMTVHSRTGTSFLYWHSLSLLLIAEGLGTMLFLSVMGSPLNWLGRSYQYLGGIYFLIALILAFRESRLRGLSIRYVLSKMVDAVELKKAEAALRRSEERWAVTLASIGDAVIATDTDSRITFLNRVAESLTGWNMSEAVGKPVEEVFNIINEFTRAPVENPAGRVLKNGEVMGLANHTVLISKGGEEVPIDNSVAPILDENGHFLGTVLIFRDITEQRQAEDRLQESEKRYRLLFENMTEGFSLGEPLFDENGNPQDFRFIEINKAFERQSGLTREAIGKPMTKVLPQLELHWIETYCGVALTGEPVRFESYNQDLGRHFDVYCYRPSKGRFAILFRDVTDRKREEAEQVRLQAQLFAERQRLNTILRQLPLAVMIAEAPSGRIIYGNAQAEALFGPDYPREGIESYPERWQPHHVDGRPLRLDEIPMVRALRGRVTSGQEMRFPNRTGNGWIDVEVSGTPILDADGNVIEGVITLSDITDRKLSEDALRESEERFRLLSFTAGRLLASPNPQQIVEELCRKVMEHLDCQAFFNFLVDERAGRLHLNACAGIPEAEAARIEWLDFGVAVCGCVAQSQARIIAEDILHTPDPRTDLARSYGIQAYACHPLMIQGRLIGTLSFGTRTRTRFSPEDLELMRVVTDQVATAMERMRLVEALQKSRDELEIRIKERTAELERSNMALQDFASIASHDLQEPLRKVNAFGNMLADKYGASLGDQGKDYLERVLSANDRMQSLLTSLLEYSRVTSRAQPMEKIRLQKIIQEVLVDLEVRMHETGGSVELGELPVIQADPTQMRQLFQNLISNALKFHKADKNPAVKIDAAAENGFHVISVEDNGIGFEEQYLEKIFLPFQKLHGRSGGYEGTGMGLAICRKIVERHGGTITAKSSPGKGTAFIVTLPFKSE